MQGVECQSQNPKRKAREMKPQARQKHPQKTKKIGKTQTLSFQYFKKKTKIKKCDAQTKTSFQIRQIVLTLEEVARAVAVCEDPKRQQLVERALKPGDRRT